MLDNNNNNNDIFINEDQLPTNMNSSDDDKKAKPHVIRRNIEDYLEQKALQKRLQDIFDDDFLID